MRIKVIPGTFSVSASLTIHEQPQGSKTVPLLCRIITRRSHSRVYE